jgi:hypothetical protein
MILGNNVKNLVITIPDEGHHSPTEQPPKRFINQTFLPENAVVNVGTNVIWFSAEENYDHVLNLNNNGQNNAAIYRGGNFIFNTPSQAIKFNTTGNFNYSDPNVSSDSKGYVMSGTIKVINQPSSLSVNGRKAIDTVGAYILPAKTVDKYISDFKSHGFSIDSMQKISSITK